jgi:hypothetical protein
MSFLSALLNPKKAIKRDMRLFNPTDIKGKNPLGVARDQARGKQRQWLQRLPSIRR